MSTDWYDVLPKILLNKGFTQITSESLTFETSGYNFGKKTMNKDSRMNEWYVPKFGPIKFKIFIGLLFLPYTGMCVSFTVLGGLLALNINFERLFAICIIYFMSLGVAAHVADNIGSKKIKPWGDIFSKKQSWILIISSLFVSYLLGLYYIIYFTPLLLIVGVLESFFLFAYNFELFDGFFHTDFWFSFSWGYIAIYCRLCNSNQFHYNIFYISFCNHLYS